MTDRKLLILSSHARDALFLPLFKVREFTELLILLQGILNCFEVE